MYREASQGERTETRELSRPAQPGCVRNQTVAAPQEVQLPGRLAVETPEWRHQEGEQRGGPGGLQVSLVLQAGGGAGAGAGGGEGAGLLV